MNGRRSWHEASPKQAPGARPSLWPVDLAHAGSFHIGSVEVRPATRELIDGNRREVVEPLVMQVLIALNSARGEIFSRDDLIDACWGGRAVSDDAVNRPLSRLRALGQQFGSFQIETITKVGFRLVGTGSGQARPARRLQLLAVALVILAIGAGLFWLPSFNRPTTALVAVVAGEKTGRADEMARNLLVHLGSIRTTDANPLQLVGGAVGTQANLVLEVAGDDGPRQTTANLALFEGDGRTLLWSKEFSQPVERRGDLSEQIAYSAAQVLKCADETMNATGKLSSATRKLYLNGCAELAQSQGGDISSVIPLFEQVTRSAPAFAGGWARLLLANTEFAGGPREATPKEQMIRYISDARRNFPGLPELALAEIETLPRSAYGRRIALAEEASRRGPTNPYALTILAFELSKAGRLNDALVNAERAVRLDPIAPAVRHTYINVLTYSGRFDRAKTAIADAERRWPGASSVIDAKLRFHIRYGDPVVASKLITATDPLTETFLRARIDRTPDNIEAALRAARAALARNNDLVGYLQTFPEFGREDALYAELAGWRGNLSDSYEVFFRPHLRRFRHDPRFMQIALRAGLLSYWHNSGNWPDFCSDADLPYDCRTEAKKHL